MSPIPGDPRAPLPVPTLRRIDRVCAAFEEAWKSGGHPAIEPFCADAAEPERSALLRELLLLDVDYRERSGDPPSRQEYYLRFPNDGRLIDTVFEHGFARPSDRGFAARGRRFGDYELLERIAHGGMGVVYKARQLSLNRVVALKMILAGQLASPEEVERFRSEAKAAANLQHPNIVAIHEVGECEGQPFFSMEYVEGQSLRDILRQGPLTAQRAAQYVKTIAEAIHYAHQQGTLHRDLKPANVLIDRSDQPRITDFGLAKQVAGGSTLTGTGQVLGTPSYMPPEQAAGNRGDVGPASDVYALGAILYELITGRPPFHGETPTETLLQVVNSEPASVRLLNPKVARDLETICLKCLQKEPRKRYPSAEALARDLDRFLRGEPIRARPVGRVERFWRWCRRRPLVAGLAAAVTVCLLAGTAISTYFAVQANLRARDATERLWSAYLAQAQAGRRSGAPGQRFESLKALAAAAAIRPSKELRDEVITCLGLADLEIERQWEYDRPDDIGVWFDPDLRCYAANDKRGDYWVRWVAGDSEPLLLPGGYRRTEDSIFSHEGHLLAEKTVSGAGAECRVWDLDRRTVIFKAPATTSLGGIGFSPDGRRIAIVGPDRALGIWDIALGVLVRSLVTDPVPDRVVCFHPNGRQVALFRAFAPVVHVLDIETGKSIRTCPHPGGVCAVAWHPSGALLAAACTDRLAYLWNVETGEQQTVLRGHQAEVVGIAFHPTGDLVVTNSWDGTTRLWDPATGNQLLSAFQDFRQFSRDGQHLACWRYNVLSLWKVATPHHPTLSVVRPERAGPWGVEFSPDGRLLAGASDGGARLWDLSSGREIAFLPLGRTCSAIFSPTGDSLVTASETGVRRWPMNTDLHSGILTLGPPTILANPASALETRACFDLKGAAIAAIVGRDRVALLSLKQPDQQRVLGPHEGVASVALSPDGRWVATGTWRGAGSVKVWDAISGNVVKELVRESPSAAVAFSPDGKWLLTSDNAGFQVWESGTWRPGRRIPREDPGLSTPMAFSRDGRMLAIACSRYAVRLIDASTLEPLARLEAPAPQGLTWLCFSPDDTQLAAAERNGTVQLWDLRAIRRQLAEMGLDWDLPPYPPAPPTDASKPASIKVVLKENSP